MLTIGAPESDVYEKKQHIPKGWTLKRVKSIADHYDRQTEDEEYEEIQHALKDRSLSWVAVPTELVGEVTRLIARRRSA